MKRGPNDSKLKSLYHSALLKFDCRHDCSQILDFIISQVIGTQADFDSAQVAMPAVNELHGMEACHISNLKRQHSRTNYLLLSGS